MTSVLSGLVLLALCGLALAQTPPVLDIVNLGKGQGDYGTSRNGRQFERYKGVQFGQSPNTTSRRFLKALDTEPWGDEVKDFTKMGQHCTQTSPLKGSDWYTLHQVGNEEQIKAGDDEDCLYTHIYTPDRNGKFPVMVWFHGGAFLDGSALIYGPKFFMDHDVVIVVPHYRLGPLGFMSMETDAIPGNAGMYDQVQALEWVQRHIESFGGDKDRVTIFGESAGAASVSFLAVSPLAKGLFTKIIAQSGAALDEWSIDFNPVYNARGIAELADCDVSKPVDDIVQCLKDVDALKLTRAYKDKWKPSETAKGRTGFGGCTPIIQTYGADPSFLPKHPLEYWNDPKFVSVPGLYGTNKHEGTYVMAIMHGDFLKPNNLTEDENFLTYDVMPIILNLFGIKDNGFFVGDAIEYEYVGIENMGNLTKMIPGLTDLTGVAFLKGASYENLKLHSKFGKSYWYTFNYADTTITLWPFISADLCSPFPGGVCHANELLMIWNIPIAGNIQSAEEEMLSKQMTNMWYNFAAYGEPNPAAHRVDGVPEIPPWSAETLDYIRLEYPIKVMQDFTKEYTIARDENFGEGFNNILPGC